MAKSFDDILRNVQDKLIPEKTSGEIWKEHINIIMGAVHALNDMYDKNTKHNLKIEAGSCSQCGQAMFVLAIREHDNPSRVLRFHKAQWKFLGENKYHCEVCREDKKEK